jgi:MraZ protein
MRRFTSRYLNKVDKKGRVSVPASFRAVLEQQGTNLIYLKPDPELGAIEGLTEAYMDEIEARIDERPIGSEERRMLEDEYFADSVEIHFDPEGRIILPRDLMDFAGITEQAMFVGLGRHFQVWRPEAYEARRAGRAAAGGGLTLAKPTGTTPTGGGA